MATITPRKNKIGKVISYQIEVYRGRDENGKKLKPYTMSWKVPDGWKQSSIEREVKKVAGKFEAECLEGKVAVNVKTFKSYSEYYIQLKERDCKHRTVNRYKELLEEINQEIGHIRLTDITVTHLNKFYLRLQKEGTRKDLKAKPRTALLDMKGNITAKYLADISGLSDKTTQAALRGNNISVSSASKIASALKMKQESLFSIVSETDGGLSPQTINHYHRLIHGILKQAVSENLISRNPADFATPPKVPKREAEFFEIEEVIAIGKALSEEPLKWQAITNLMIDTGARRGEIMGLKWNSVDLKQCEITIENNLQYTPEKGIYDETPKTDECRTISISKPVAALLGELRKEQLQEQLRLGTYWIQTEYCFVNDRGEVLHPDSINTWLSDFSKRHNLPHIHPHKFRHTQASILYYAGLDPVTISNRLGHSDVSTTQNIYSHLLKGADHKASSVMEKLLYDKNVSSQ